jgi:hypothetical protein
MFARGIILAALFVYLAVVIGCVVAGAADGAKGGGAKGGGAAAGGGPAEPRAASRTAGLPFRGAALQLQRVDWIDTEYRKGIDEIVEMGFDSVLLVVPGHMQNAGSSRIYLDMRLTPTAAQVGSIIDYSKGRGLRVVLMPIVLLDKPRTVTEWRGTIRPDDWSDWWQSYRDFMYHFSWIAESHKADVLVVGSELVSTEKQAEEWRKTIALVRKVFNGLLTYSANWDHYKEIPFWGQLDLIGMNSYYTLGDNHRVSVAEIERRWRKIQDNLLKFQKQVGKPLVLLEAGWCSLQNAAHEPWDYTRSEVPVDLDLQRRLYEGFLRSWHGVEGFGGYMIWEWTVGDGGPTDRGYTPKGKPAEQTLREWLARPRWKVR